MKVFLLTLFPRALESYFETSIMQKAQQQWLLELHICNIADFSVKATRRADDRPYGWFAGTILAPEPCSRAMDDCISKNGGPIEWIAPDPRGEPLCQNTLWELSVKHTIWILCGHYEGIDERLFEEYSIQKVALGPYVITGGELAAAVIIDGVTRLIPGLLSDESLREESFSVGLHGKKEYPHYTRPEKWRERNVPPALLSGNHRLIEEWKKDNIH